MFLNVWNILYLKNASLSANQCTFILQQFLSFLKHVHCYKKRKNEVDPDKFEIMTFLPKMDVNDDKSKLLKFTQQHGTKHKPTTMQLKTLSHALTHMEKTGMARGHRMSLNELTSGQTC